MKSHFWLKLLLPLFFLMVASRAAESLDDAVKRATVDYDQRVRLANGELIQTRERIAREKTPLLEMMRQAEDRIIAAQAEITRLETDQEHGSEKRYALSQETEGIRKNESYMNTLAHDSLAAFQDGLLPGEKQFMPGEVEALQDAFGNPSKLAGAKRAADVADLLLKQIETSLGGYLVTGTSLIEGDNRLVSGTFAFVGPEVFFRADEGGKAGTVRAKESTGRAVTYILPEWKSASFEAFFQGRPGTILADASAGKALRLKETKGTVWQHIRKGGVVSYAIIGVGILAGCLIALKIRDLARMSIGDSRDVQRCLEAMGLGSDHEIGSALRMLKTTTRELFVAGLRHRQESRELLEERLTAILLRQRLHYERWLPLLAVIATAAPLMGLLGTVTGMVRTFTLITVFGTGNAGKLAGGISEVLVATELGLMVAIPTLVAHGFLSQRIQKNLSLLERYALEFVTAVQAGKSGARAKEPISA